MATVPLPHSRPFRIRPRHALFACVALMLANVLFHTEHFLIDGSDPSWPHYHDIGRWLLPHGLIGAMALVLSFMQFSVRLRTRYTRVHRVSGRIYITAVCIVAPLGAYLSYLDRDDTHPRDGPHLPRGTSNRRIDGLGKYTVLGHGGRLGVRRAGIPARRCGIADRRRPAFQSYDGWVVR